ncbi:TetR/AcrR family transcriptional regulator [Novosphingobium sp. BL-8A]|uniref:TetR family transcriptional regulator n=1 Tax=Novosphingobium sp. BL-8A TaxID=3127639 RepID=UPI003757D433
MIQKPPENPPLKTRSPRQGRAVHKVELMLEAAMRLLDDKGYEAFTTNAVAETAGVSIGTLYQYFPNKEAILDSLADREMAALSERILTVLADKAMVSVRERVGLIVRAVTTAYGDRRRVHRLLMERSLARGTHRMAPLLDHLTTLLSSPSGPNAPGSERKLTRGEAFVITTAFVGVLRAMIMRPESAPSDAEIEDGLVRLVMGYADLTNPVEGGSIQVGSIQAGSGTTSP